MKCEWRQVGNCPYLYEKMVVGKSGPGQSEVRGEVGVVGVKKACGHGGGGELYTQKTICHYNNTTKA
jgi:hypothetical protein